MKFRFFDVILVSMRISDNVSTQNTTIMFSSQPSSSFNVQITSESRQNIKSSKMTRMTIAGILFSAWMYHLMSSM